jgi:hypothetical protein
MRREQRRQRFGLLTRAAIASGAAFLIASPAIAVTTHSWEGGTLDGWQDSFNTPGWTEKTVGSFGATDGNAAYSFKTQPNFGFRGEVVYANATAPWASADDTAKWNGYVAGNMLFADVSVQGERDAPIDANAANFVALWPALNGPGGGFIGSYNNPVDGGSGATAQYQLVFATEYFSDVRTRTLAWDYVNAGYNFAGLTATENPPGSGSWSNHYSILHWSQNGRNGGVRVAFDNIRTYRARATDPTYTGGAASTWGNAASWTNGTPNAVGAVAHLKGTADTAVAITVNAPVTVGTLMINNVQRSDLGRPLDTPATLYTINGTSTITLDNGAAEAALVVLTGVNTVSAPINVASNAVIDLAGDPTTGETQGVPTLSTTLNVGNITIAAGKTLRTTSVGTLNVSGNVNGGAGSSLKLNGRRVNLTGSSSQVVKAGELTLATSGKLDIGDGNLIVDHAGTSPAADLRAAVIAGRLTSADLTSTTAIGIRDVAAAGTLLGQSYDATTTLVRFTLKGDATLDRTVNFDDLLALAAGYNAAGTWQQGDFNYDGQVNFDDLLSLAANYNQTLTGSLAGDWALAVSGVPEPTTLLVAACSAALTLRRRCRA